MAFLLKRVVIVIMAMSCAQYEKYVFSRYTKNLILNTVLQYPMLARSD
jgi:hypothetical protein